MCFILHKVTQNFERTFPGEKSSTMPHVVCSWRTQHIGLILLRSETCFHISMLMTHVSVASALHRQPVLSHFVAFFKNIAAWTSSNRLKLNAVKTEVLWCTSVLHLYKFPTQPFVVCCIAMAPATNVCDLGVWIGCRLATLDFILDITFGFFAILCQLCIVRSSLPRELLTSLVVTLILTRTDPRRSAYNHQLNCLQSVLHPSSRSCDAAASWLSLRKRIQIKLYLFAYRCPNDVASVCFPGLRLPACVTLRVTAAVFPPVQHR